MNKKVILTVDPAIRSFSEFNMRDWTDFDHDDQSTLVLSLVTSHDRATPLPWLSVWKDEITKQRNDFEDACLRRLSELVPPGWRVTILADRGEGEKLLIAQTTSLMPMGRPSPPLNGWACSDAARHHEGPAGQRGSVRACQGMKEPWCLATSEQEATAATLVNHDAKRWTIEPQFRDTKDLRFGMGLSSTRIDEPMRRDRLLLISAFATALLTLLGTAGERLGMDRMLEANTSKTRRHSLFRQGCMLYELIPNMPERAARAAHGKIRGSSLNSVRVRAAPRYHEMRV
jgi:hypothetical protein